MVTKTFVLIVGLALLGVLALAACVGQAVTPSTEMGVATQETAALPEEVTPTGTSVPTFIGPCPDQPEEKVVILVIDDFEKTRPLEETLKEPTPLLAEISQRGEALTGQNCILTPYGQAHFTGDGAGFFGEVCGQAHFTGDGAAGDQCLKGPHGATVVEYLAQLAGSTPQIFIAEVPTAGYSTSTVVGQTQAAVDFYTNSCPVKGIVLNMSFSIVPCGTLPMTRNKYEQELTSTEWSDFQAVLNQLVDSYRQSGLDAGMTDEELKDLIYQASWWSGRRALLNTYPDVLDKDRQDTLRSGQFFSGEVDPLYAFVTSRTQRTDISIPLIGVASAGNWRQPYPYAPAIWNTVLSVSTPAEYSNAGEVSMPLSIPDYSGTSFAAPELSVRAAMYLLNGGSIACSGQDGRSTSPPLKYAPYTNDYQNLPLPTAVITWCNGFPDR